MGQVLLTIQEAAELEGVSYDTMNKKVQRKALTAVKMSVPKRKGFEYRIELENLTSKAQRRYYSQIKDSVAAVKFEDSPDKFEDMSLLDLTAGQRDKAAFWKKIVTDWRRYIRDAHKETTVKTGEYLKMINVTYEDNPLFPDNGISERTLRRKWSEYQKHGEIALADYRGQARKTAGHSINEIAYSVFLQWWLDEAEPKVSQVYRLVKCWAELRMPDLLPLPSEDTFYRATKKLPLAVTKYFRGGEKEFEDDCLQFMIRTYENFDSNEIWSADYHTLDFFVKDDVTGKVFRPHAIVWLDVRSRKILSVTLCESANSDGTIIGFRKAVMNFGVPYLIYLDNGKEFLVRDFGGKGRRKSDAKADYGQTILQRLGVEMHNAKVRNAKAKVIERVFRNITFDFSKFVSTYTGGSPAEKPERLKTVLKDAQQIPLLSEARGWLEAYIEGWYNEMPSQAEGLDGMSPNACYPQHLTKIRKAPAEELELMLLRNERLQKITENGVYVKISNEKIWFNNDEFVSLNLGKQVYVRYNPEDLSRVFIYDDKEVKLAEAELIRKVGYDFTGETTKEAIKKLNSSKKKRKETVTGFMDGLTGLYEAPPVMDILVEKSRRAMDEAAAWSEPNVIEPISISQGREKAAGGEEVTIDFNRMIENARKRRRSD